MLAERGQAKSTEDFRIVLEDVWRESTGPEKKFLQALIQIAVGLHHHSRGNQRGALSLLARATRNLEAYPEVYGGLRLAPLRKHLEAWNHALAKDALPPPIFKIQLRTRGLGPGFKL